MKIKQLSLTEQAIEDRDYRDTLVIEIDGNIEFQVHDGEPEDACLSRDFNDCYNITDLMKQAYEAGKNDEDFEIICEEMEEL
ncbi:MAG: hypothetical protein E6X21_03215 [Clostridium sp.]|uniref:hypothetical protein n=1 Tax=Clostridium sp. TaxID=1506 RepID=UPI002907CDB3|nr:hypothetical protein [Clostridium sp.]